MLADSATAAAELAQVEAAREEAPPEEGPRPAATPPATIEVLFRSDAGLPVPGVRVSLCALAEGPSSASPDSPAGAADLRRLAGAPPLLGVDWSRSGTERTSGAGGSVSWNVASGDYGWRILSDHWFWPQDRPSGDDPLRDSGAFAVCVGESRQFQVTLPTGVVTGALQIPGTLEGGAWVKVFDSRPGRECPPGTRLREEDLGGLSLEASLTSPDGAFRFTGISPGSKVLAAAIEVVGHHFYFHRQGFDMQAGACVELGLIPCLGGSFVNGEITLEKNGERVSTDEVFGCASLEAILVMLNESGGWEDLFVEQILDVCVGEPFTLHGLPERKWRFSASAGSHEKDWWPAPRPGYTVETRAGCVLRPGETELRLVFPVKEVILATMSIHYPAGVEPFRAVAYLRPESGEVVEVDIKPGRKVQGAQTDTPAPLSRSKQFYCAPGPHDVLVHADPLFVSEPLVWYAEGRVDITADNPTFTLVLVEGSAIRGTSPRPGGLGFGLAGWTDARGGLLDVYLVKADATGSFVVPGVPPGRTLLSDMYAPIRSGAPGQVVEATLSR